MAFDLTEKLQNVFKNLRSKGRLTEEDVKAALKEVKMALLEADVNFKVVKNFVKKVQERAVGQDVLNSLTPGQMVVKLVNEELVALMGSETTEIALRPSNEITVLLMCGLLGRWVEEGQYPDDRPLLEEMVADICYRNSVSYFGFQHHHLRGYEK